MTPAAERLVTTATNVNTAIAIVRRGVNPASLRFCPAVDRASWERASIFNSTSRYSHRLCGAGRSRDLTLRESDLSAD
jgi:hypothetical protein